MSTIDCLSYVVIWADLGLDLTVTRLDPRFDLATMRLGLSTFCPLLLTGNKCQTFQGMFGLEIKRRHGVFSIKLQ